MELTLPTLIVRSRCCMLKPHLIKPHDQTSSGAAEDKCASPQQRDTVTDVERFLITTLTAKFKCSLHHTNAKERYRNIHSKNKTIHHIWYTRHTHISLEMHPPQYCLHVLDLQVRRRTIVNVTAKSKPASTVDLRQTVGSTKTYKSKRRTAIAHLIATYTFIFCHTNAKESYRKIHNTN